MRFWVLTNTNCGGVGNTFNKTWKGRLKRGLDILFPGRLRCCLRGDVQVHRAMLGTSGNCKLLGSSVIRMVNIIQDSKWL